LLLIVVTGSQQLRGEETYDCDVAGMLSVEKQNWCPLAEQAVSLIYRLAEHPDLICADIIKKQAVAFLPPKHEASAGPRCSSFCFSQLC